ncbi:MAG: methyltransferase domain-containing protein [Sandaracinaceae bacterium]
MMSTAIPEIDVCEVCGGRDLRSVLDLGGHPMCDDLVPVGESRVCAEYPIEILFCSECVTAHQRFQVPKRDLFPPTYHYRSRFTADVLDGMRRLVDMVAERYGSLEGRAVLDIGCNDGSLLGFFAERGARTVGVEPTGAGADAAEKGHRVFTDYFTTALAGEIAAEIGRPKVITFTNVFAHIEDLGDVLGGLAQLLDDDTKIVIENHYLGAIFERQQFDTFYHEHPRTYSCTSFYPMAKTLGLSVQHVEFPSRYGGNIRVVLGRGPEVRPEDVLAREREFAKRFDELRGQVATWRTSSKERLQQLVAEHGPLRAKAFPGRAAILVRLLEIDVDTIKVVHEKPGSMKLGHYVPGTRIPIVSDDEMDTEDSTPIVNLAWHISKEIRTYLTGRGYRGTVIDILG